MRTDRPESLPNNAGVQDSRSQSAKSQNAGKQSVESQFGISRTPFNSEIYTPSTARSGVPLAWLAIILFMSVAALSVWQAVPLYQDWKESSNHDTYKNTAPESSAGMGFLAVEPETKPLTSTTPMAKKPLELSESGLPFTIDSIKRDLNDPVGRSDPFSPLVRPVVDTPAGPVGTMPEEKRDALLDVQYTGFIGNAIARDKVAIIRVADPSGTAKTLIKKAGESFIVDGEKAVLTSVSSSGIKLRLSGRQRVLAIQPYMETPVANLQNGAGVIVPAVSGVPSGMSMPPGMPAGLPANLGIPPNFGLPATGSHPTQAPPLPGGLRPE